MKIRVINNRYPVDNAIEKIRKSLPRGKGEWKGYDKVYDQISKACDCMGLDSHLALSDDHIRAMAILGSGHEETMKGELFLLCDKGIIK